MPIKTLKWKIETKATQIGEVNPRMTERDLGVEKRIGTFSETISPVKTMAETIGTMVIEKGEIIEDNTTEEVNITRTIEIVQGNGIMNKIKSKETTIGMGSTESMDIDSIITIDTTMNTDSTTKAEIETTESRDATTETMQTIVIIASERPITPTVTRGTILIIDVFICKAK